jgi:hypothetical protein
MDVKCFGVLEGKQEGIELEINLLEKLKFNLLIDFEDKLLYWFGYIK